MSNILDKSYVNAKYTFLYKQLALKLLSNFQDSTLFHSATLKTTD